MDTNTSIYEQYMIEKGLIQYFFVGEFKNASNLRILDFQVFFVIQ
jgi:hypothetical protein